MKKKRLIALFLALFLIIAIQSIQVFAQFGCCVSSTECEVALPGFADTTDCQQRYGPDFTYYQTDCNLIDDCDFGCCCPPQGQPADMMPNNGMIRLNYCTQLGGTFNFLNDYDPFTETQYPPLICTEPQYCGAGLIPACTIVSCESPVTEQCSCAGRITEINQYCCGADSAVYDIQRDCFFASPTCAAASGVTFNVRGFVRDINDNAIPSASVFLAQDPSIASTSGPDGSFELTDVPAGIVEIVATKPTYAQNSTEIALIEDTDNVIIVLPPAVAVDSDNDGTPDDMENCDYEPLLLNPATGSELGLCTDDMDNDCDTTPAQFAAGIINKDCFDPDCADDSACVYVPVCGNNLLDIGEECDPPSEVSAQCDGLRCYDNCVCEKIGVAICGNNIWEPPEECDGSQSFACPGLCSDVCTCPEIEAECGNGLIEGNEECEFIEGTCPDACDPLLDVPGLSCGEPNTPTQCLFNFQVPECGDGILEEPMEECELDTDCLYPGQCISCQCYYPCTEEPAAPVLNPIEFIADGLKISWLHEGGECGFINFNLYRCEVTGNQTECEPLGGIPLAATTLKEYSDTDVEGNSKYCYKVETYYDSGTKRFSDIVCESTGHPVCMKGLGEFCEQGSIMQCDEQMEATLIETCSDQGEDYVCVQYGPQNAVCERQSECDVCNNVFGIFANAMLEVMYAAPGEESLPTPCTDLPTCYLDRANSIVKEYKECSHIKTCYDYKSMEACELNKCGADLPLNCTWEESPSYKNFGVGVCHPTDEAKQQCGKCGEIESIDFSQQITEKDFNPYNLLYGQCDEEICTLYGACYYSNDVCSHRKDMACVDYYTNEQDCVGSTSQYSYNGEEIFADSVANSGVKIDAFADDGAQHDNSVLIPSDDFFNLNKCRWNESTFRCFKDANNDGKADCSFDDAQCQKDNEPPTTYVTPKSNVVVNITGVKRYLFGNTFFANISVYDNKPGEVTTYFCIDANYCYPLNLTANENLISHTFDVPLNQTMKMFYFSEDRAHNLEVLKSVDLFVDTIPPTITFTNKSNSRDNGYDQWFTNLNLEIFATENFDNVVYCEAKLTTVEGELIQDYNNIDDYGNYWNLTYYNLLDGNYQFHYSCTDRALNVNEGVLEIKIDGDLSLTNPLPDAEILSAGNVDIEISIISNKTADCKFDDILPVAGTIEEVYAAMENNFGVTGSTQHRHLIIIPEESRYYSYDVKCKFTAPEVPEWQRIQGNMGDRITFSVDVDSPEIQPTFVDGTVIDRKLGNPLPLYFKCNDDTVRLLSNVSGMDFGCDYVVYQLPLKDDPGVSGSFRKDYTEGEELVRIDYAGDGHEFNSSIAIPYTVYDKGGNSKSDVITLNIDTSLPEFEPVIYLGTEPKTALTSGEYKLVITSTKPLNYINPGFEVKGINIPLTFLRGTEDPLALNISTEWTFRIPLPMENPQFDIASAMARLTIEGTDLTDNTNVQQFEFEIRTRPPSKPVIQPDFKIYDERYNYPLHNYNSEDESFYTNESLLFISGFTNQHLLRIEYYVNDLLQTTYDEETQNSPEGDGELKTTTTSAAGKGDTTIRILGNLVGSPNWQPGKFIAFEEHTRESWGHYDELYEIIDITAFSAEESNIVLAQPLEYDIDQGEEISLYEKKRTYNSFGEYALLEIGENVLYLKTRDAVDLSGKTDEYKIFYDPHPPEVIEHYPPAGTIRDNMTKVWVKIKEKKIGSGLCLENCPTQHQPKLVLNGIIKQTTIETESDDFFNYYTITYDPNATNEVMDGDYEVKFIAKDFAGNELTGAAEWNFTVDMLAPTRPEFRVEGATEHNDVWYTNSLAPPTFTLEFADIEPVTVTGIYIDNRYNTANVECTRQANLFTCAFQEPLEPTYVEGQAGIVKIMNDDWDIIVTAYKTLADNTTSPEGVYGDNILVIDTIQPQFASVVDYTIDELYYTRDEINLSLPWHILNELHDLDASLTFKGTTYHLTQTGKVGENYEFVWAIPTFTSEGPGTATLRIADYAGNSVTVTGQIYIDLTPPGITLNQIEIPETIVIEGEKTTRQTVITINGLLRPEDTDIKHVYVTPGDFIGGIQYDERKYSLLEPIDRPESFTLNLVLKGEVEAVTENPINITIVDKAGYIVPQSLRVFVDLKPPAPPMVRFV